MLPVLWAQWRKERRSPFLVLIFCGIAILASVLFALNANGKMKVDVFGGKGLSKAEEQAWIEQLNQSTVFQFAVRDETEARKDVREGRADAAVLLMPEDYRIISAVDNPNVQIVERHIRRVFDQELTLRAAAQKSADPGKFRQDADNGLRHPALAIRTQAPEGGNVVKYDMGVHFLFGFTLFLSIFTIAFKVSSVTMEKTSGIWNRVILSPVRKTEMYLGHLSYSFLVGFAQIAVVLLIFLYGFGIHLGAHFGMLLVVAAIFTLAMVSFCMLLAGLLRKPEQYNAILPPIIPIMPMLGGVYVAPGVITNKVVLAVSEIFPITHAMKALTGIAVYGEGWSDVFMPLAKMLLIAVLCMGVGINLVERQKA